MYLLHRTTRGAQAFIEFLSMPKIELFMKRLILWTFIINTAAISILCAKFFVFNQPTPLAQAQTESGDIPKKPIMLGSATQDFVQRLKDNYLAPAVVSKVTRKQFTVEGRMFASNGDSFQVFEYPDNETAMKEASDFIQKYESRLELDYWKRAIHIYVDGSLVIYYVGTNADIAEALDQHTSTSLEK